MFLKVFCGEALNGALVSVHRWVSTGDVSREFSHGPFVWMVHVVSLVYGFITLLYLCVYIYGENFIQHMMYILLNILTSMYSLL